MSLALRNTCRVPASEKDLVKVYRKWVLGKMGAPCRISDVRFTLGELALIDQEVSATAGLKCERGESRGRFNLRSEV